LEKSSSAGAVGCYMMFVCIESWLLLGASLISGYLTRQLLLKIRMDLGPS